jgi:hypothetical protein
LNAYIGEGEGRGGIWYWVCICKAFKYTRNRFPTDGQLRRPYYLYKFVYKYVLCMHGAGGGEGEMESTLNHSFDIFLSYIFILECGIWRWRWWWWRPEWPYLGAGEQKGLLFRGSQHQQESSQEDYKENEHNETYILYAIYQEIYRARERTFNIGT